MVASNVTQCLIIQVGRDSATLAEINPVLSSLNLRGARAPTFFAMRVCGLLCSVDDNAE